MLYTQQRRRAKRAPRSMGRAIVVRSRENALDVDSAATVAAEEPEPELDLGPLSAAWRIGGPASVAVRLSFVAKLFDRYLTRQLSESGLTVAQWRVMAQLSAVDENTVRELAAQAWVDRAEVSPLSDSWRVR